MRLKDQHEWIKELKVLYRAVWALLLWCCEYYKEVGGVGRKIFAAEKLATQLLVEGCYGTERTFIWPTRNPPCIRLHCACAQPSVKQGHVNSVLTTIKLYWLPVCVHWLSSSMSCQFLLCTISPTFVWLFCMVWILLSACLIDRHTLSIFSDKPLTYATHRVLFSLLSLVSHWCWVWLGWLCLLCWG